MERRWVDVHTKADAEVRGMVHTTDLMSPAQFRLKLKFSCFGITACISLVLIKNLPVSLKVVRFY